MPRTMLRRIRFPRLFLALLLLFFVHLPASNAQNVEPFKFFRDYVGLKDDQITAIRNGKPVAKVVESRTPDEVFVFGSVYVQSTPEQYLKLASDIDELRKLPSYLAIRRFSDPPQLSDLDGFTLEADDIKQLKNCEPGKCDVQLPTEAMDVFKQSVNWSAPGAANQVNRLAQKMALEAIQRYIQGGNAALGTYMDKHHPAVVGETFTSLLSRSKALPAYLPELERYLLKYPEAKSENIQSEFYWEKVNFGLKPTLRIVQAIIHRGPRSTDPAYAVAVKQLYASHYFETALDLTVCVRDQESPDRGFYLITLKGSQQAGLTGLKGGIVRKVAVGCRWRFMVSPDRRTASALLTILLFAIVLAVVYVARTVIVIFAFSILFAYLINPIVRFLQRHSLFFKNLRGPHVLEAYLALIVFTLLLSHGLFPQFRKSAGQLLAAIPTLTDRVSSGEIASNLGSNLGWADEQADQIRIFLQRHRANVERAAATIEQFAPAALAGFVVIPILAIFFLNDGENIANQVIHLVSTRENHAALRSLADELHAMLQRYIRAKVILGGLSLLYCLIAMLLLGFPNAIVLGVLAGILEFIPVVGWMTAAATIVTAGVLTHSHWIWMLALLGVWRILMDYAIAPRVMGHELEIHPLLAIFTVMGHELEIHPLLAIFTLMVGGAVGGIVGIYLSVPLVATLRVIYRRFASPPVGATSRAVFLTAWKQETRHP